MAEVGQTPPMASCASLTPQAPNASSEAVGCRFLELFLLYPDLPLILQLNEAFYMAAPLRCYDCAWSALLMTMLCNKEMLGLRPRHCLAWKWKSTKVADSSIAKMSGDAVADAARDGSRSLVGVAMGRRSVRLRTSYRVKSRAASTQQKAKLRGWLHRHSRNTFVCARSSRPSSVGVAGCQGLGG